MLSTELLMRSGSCGEQKALLALVADVANEPRCGAMAISHSVHWSWNTLLCSFCPCPAGCWLHLASYQTGGIACIVPSVPARSMRPSSDHSSALCSLLAMADKQSGIQHAFCF